MKRFFICLLFTFGIVVQGYCQNVPSQLTILETPVTITPGGAQQVQEKLSSLTRSQSAFNDYLNRCLSYFPIIERELQVVGVPQDYKFLALQESTLDGSAVSKSDAVGYWQFKAPTAEEYQLLINNQVDERKNIVSSTRAAGNYFKKSHHYLNNWVYSLLSYYTGLTGAKNHIAENNLTNQIIVDENTHYYIVHFIAHYLAFSNAYEQQRNRSNVYLVEYAGGVQNNLFEIAQFVDQIVPNSGMDINQYTSLLETYNPWLLADRIPQGGQYCYSVILPLRPGMRDPVVAQLKTYACGGLARGKSNKEFYADTLKNMYPFIVTQKDLSSGKTYQEVYVNGVRGLLVKKDVKLKKLLKEVGVSRDDFFMYNDEQVEEKLGKNAAYYLEEKPETIPLSYHIVEEDETLGYIAQLYGIQLGKLLEWNELSPDATVNAGAKIFFNPE